MFPAPSRISCYDHFKLHLPSPKIEFPSLRADWVGVGQSWFSNREQLEFIFEHSAAQSQLERNGKIRYKENIAAGKRRYARTLVHDFEAHQSNYET